MAIRYSQISGCVWVVVQYVMTHCCKRVKDFGLFTLYKFGAPDSTNPHVYVTKILIGWVTHGLDIAL